jgi:hypothetical protein
MGTRFLTAVFAISLVTLPATVFAEPVIKVMASSSNLMKANVMKPNVMNAIRAQFNMDQYREVRIQPVGTDHALVYLLSKKYHRFDIVSVNLDKNANVTSITKNYRLRALDRKALTTPKCPDAKTQFIAFAPNTDDTEQGVTVAVANEAIAKGLNTVQLLEEKATTQNYMDYMVCPNLVGNFYDGDSNPDEFITVDGTISASEVAEMKWHSKVTNIWVACEAYNAPMLPAVQDSAQAQKYAAGINDLEVGPSDNAAQCAMIAAIDGKPMTAAFESCYKQFDDPADQWGFGGNGSDTFGL